MSSDNFAQVLEIHLASHNQVWVPKLIIVGINCICTCLMSTWSINETISLDRASMPKVNCQILLSCINIVIIPCIMAFEDRAPTVENTLLSQRLVIRKQELWKNNPSSLANTNLCLYICRVRM